MTSPTFLDELNPVQRQAAEALQGPVMIIAGAGSGKTRVLTYRMANLLSKGVDAFQILALTFTNKAAREMKERIAQLVGTTEARNLWMGTFHSVFAKILRVEAEKLGYPPNFTIYDNDDSKSLIKTIIRGQNLDDKIYKPGMVLNRISSCKNNLISWQAYQRDATIQADDNASMRPKMGLIYELYQKRCFQAGAMDFDDLLYQMNVLLRDFPEVLNKYQHKFRYILVDEYQDTNISQYLIVKKLAAAFENICVVGDDAQSIYAFRGANIDNILNFKRDYPQLQTYKLEQNYRSTQVIVAAANQVISNNKEQIKKEVWTENPSGDSIKILKSLTENEEGWQVAQAIFEHKMNHQAANRDFAILYRTNAQSRAMEEALRKMGIPYRIYGGLSFYKRKEIKDLLAYFRMVINPNDEEALKRIINYPARGIGATTLDRLVLTAAESGTSIWSVLTSGNPIDGLQASARQRLDDFTTLIRSFQVELRRVDAFTLANRIAVSTGILKELFQDKSVEGVSRYDNIQELLNGIKDFVDHKNVPISPPDALFDAEPGQVFAPVEDAPRHLDQFMEDIALLTDAEEEEEKPGENDKVVMMTVHAAKGLEFPYVFVVGLEENLFPSQMALSDRKDLEEERRLFYVAVTRAERSLTLSYSQSRYKFGQLLYSEPSRFILEINRDLLNFSAPSALGSVPRQTSGFGEQRPLVRKTGAAPNAFSRKPEAPAPKPPQLKPGLKKVVPGSSSVSSGHQITLIAGQRVRHEKFGEGEVLSLEGDPPNEKANIRFASVGIKPLLLRFARLEII
jgi:DNA helicase-2/ATP-dependent DNA helicase PcrA